MLSTLVLTALAAPPDFAFAFSNADGTQFLALDSPEAPARLNRVSCDGAVHELSYVAEQPAGEGDTGRQTARNFSQAKGSLFKLVTGAAPPDSLCLLGTEAAFTARKLAPVATLKKPGLCDAKAKALVGKLGGRTVTKCFATATLEGGRLFFATYARKGASVLAAVVLQEANGAASIRKFPATRPKDGSTCWRVDDGCEFLPRLYRVVFAARGGEGTELFARWAGAEGENAEWLQVKGEELSVAASASRYWSPE